MPKIVAGSLTFFLSNATAEEVQEAVKAGCEGLHGIGFLLFVLGILQLSRGKTSGTKVVV